MDLDSGTDTDIEAAWAAEIEKRIDEIESGEAETVGWEEVRARIKTKLARS